MEGRHPGSGRWLRPEGAGGGRGGGIDVTFSAPKSVSTVWALGDPWQREQIEQAHARAVEQTVRHLREQVPVVRRRYSGQVVEEHAKDVIATEYRHTTARGVAGAQAPDPQLHSHVVITAAVREDDRIVAVASRPIFRSARELGADSPALAGQTLTLDSLVARANTGAIHVGRDTTVILDEAGMVDHKRLDVLTELVEPSGAKLIAVGDGKQLPSIGPGGMFDRLTNHAPTAELADIHRTKDPADQRAWQALRAGEPERAMAHYASRGELHLSDTRDQAAEQAVQTWATLTEGRDIREVALIADASNQEIDRLNARAQHLRAERGELGHPEIPLPGVHYGLREGDLIAFTTQHRPRGQSRVENGTRGQVSAVHDRGVTITLDGSERRVKLAGEHLDSLRLAYAQHVYRQQGATVERSVVLTGGWQTSKETAYVEATRARHGTTWFIAREDLGEVGQDAGRITRLAQKMANSRTQTPSLAYPERPNPGWAPSRDPYGFALPYRRHAG